MESTEGVRVLCIQRRSILLITDDRGWTLPRGTVLPGETAEQAAARVLVEQCRVRPRLLRRITPPTAVRGLGADWLVVAHTETDLASPHTYVNGTPRELAFHPVTAERPIGPLDLWLWGGLSSIAATSAHQSTWIGAHAKQGVA